MTAAPFEPRLASLAAVLADATRARMLSYLLSGEYASAGELARAASVTAATASGHLVKMLDAQLVVCEQRGRHRYYRLADDEVAHALEAMALIAERRSHEASWANPTRTRLRFARCCYGHLAGQLGVELFSQLLSKEWIAPAGEGYGLTASGRAGLAELGLLADALGTPSSGRRLAYRCLDWSERRDHLAGTLPKALLAHCLQQGWLRRLEGERALALTPPGRQRLATLLPSVNTL
ncbi:helix-turn-helix transcriptional regulator [Curvibacter sp. APW13]|uniref:ArsR/SmtB family transcription factor n=1 Tax=Curvibacter sp. APW13 TaxID=3077236 RepID=UPI0028DEA04B|nr:helix-turn-helix transcriptional regulator [Curvibacter sp. APW13]MDT8989970.1 helix-turn-helix transcriptional regulator [Curvibacter sp. APW13]